MEIQVEQMEMYYYAIAAPIHWQWIRTTFQRTRYVQSDSFCDFCFYWKFQWDQFSVCMCEKWRNHSQKKYHPIRLREIKQQMEHWNSNCSAQWMENGVSMSKAKHIIIWKGKKKLNPKSSSKIWRDRERKRRKWDTKIKTIPIYLNWLLHSSPHLTDHFQLSCPEFSRNQERTRKNVKQI